MRNKIYYPKSHIIANLYTSGQEWMLEDGTEYKGYYHRYIDGKVLSGAVYSELESKTLIPYIKKTAQPENFLYNSLVAKKTFQTPQAKINIPTLEMYNKGKYNRFFLRRRNFTSFEDIMEIDEKQFDLWSVRDTGIDDSIYDAISISWKLTGPLNDQPSSNGTVYGVLDTNRRLVFFKDRVFPGLKNFLTDYIEYSIYARLTSPEIKKLFVK
jgi:hypothetical protein